MIQPTKWWIGLPLLAVLFVFEATLNSETVEKDIAERARSALAQDPRALDDAQLSVAGRDVSVSGVALSRDAAAKLLETIERQEGVRAVVDATIAPPLAKPFTFVLERKGKRLALSGHAPVSGERDTVRAAAASAGLEVADTAAYAVGAPQNFSALASYALALLETLGDGRIVIADSALTVSGAAETFDIYERASAALRAPPSGAVVRAVDITPPRVSPFVWSAVKSGDAVGLFGFAPSSELRDSLAGKAASLAGAATTRDQSRVASGAPAGDFAAAATLALSELAELSQGKVALTDAKLSIEGMGKPNVAAAALEARVRAALPKGFELGRVDVAAGPVSPYVFTAHRQGETLALAGYAPDAAAHAKIAELAKRDFGGRIADEIVVAEGAPRGFVEATTAALRALARLSSGAVALSDRQIALDGAAFHANAPEDIKSRFARELPEGFESAARLGVAPLGEDIPPSQLFGALSDVAARGIFFNADNSAIVPDSLPVVDALALVLLRSPDAAIDIVGRFGDSGSEAENEAIARRRAQLVLDYLTVAGVDPARLTATGAGSAGDDDQGSPKRRIEFTIK